MRNFGAKIQKNVVFKKYIFLIFWEKIEFEFSRQIKKNIFWHANVSFIGTNQALSLLVLCELLVVALWVSDFDFFFLEFPLDLLPCFMGGVSDPLSKSFREELLAELLIRERVPAPKTPSALSKRLRVLVLSHFLIAFSALVLLFSGFLKKKERKIEL